MPVCIAGMHRSGTSMVARLLNLCGLHLGPTTDLLPPGPSNPAGFWESRPFLRINDAVLRELGGTWYEPPLLPAGWEHAPGLAQLRERASRLLRRFPREPWGWKDPRNSLTLPLWRTLVPPLKVLVCVRGPLAVAESLSARDGFPLGRSLDLWLTYNRRVLDAGPSGNRVVTHYDRYFHDPVAELGRVIDQLGLNVPQEQIVGACATINPSLTHHRESEGDFAGTGVSAEVRACYRELCAEAGLARP